MKHIFRSIFEIFAITIFYSKLYNLSILARKRTVSVGQKSDTDLIALEPAVRLPKPILTRKNLKF